MSTKKPLTRTLAQLEANRRNAQHSTGPRTSEGKAIAARNSFAHGFYTRPDRLMREQMARLGDNFDLLARLSLDLARSWRPRNAMQALLVTDLARLFWRKAQLERTMHASRVWEMEQGELSLKIHNLDPDGPDDPIDSIQTEMVGFRGNTSSLPAMGESLRLLNQLTEIIRRHDWATDIGAIATPLYGECITPVGREILEILHGLAQPDAGRDTMEEESACFRLIKLIMNEATSIMMQQARLRQEKNEEFGSTQTSSWLPTTPRWAIVLDQDAQLDRMIESKTKLLIRLQQLDPAENSDPQELPEAADGSAETRELIDEQAGPAHEPGNQA